MARETEDTDTEKCRGFAECQLSVPPNPAWSGLVSPPETGGKVCGSVSNRWAGEPDPQSEACGLSGSVSLGL